jgi:5-methylcytosine-specific restriction enzyme subunit McrC
MRILQLRDSSFFCPDEKPNIPNPAQSNGLFCAAIDRLRNDFLNKKIHKISLKYSKAQKDYEDAEPPVNYEIKEICKCYAKGITVPYEIKFRVSHYIGNYTTNVSVNGKSEQVSIQIKPRWGDGRMLVYMLRHAFDLVVPIDAWSSAKHHKIGSEWLLVMLWKCAFDQAIKLACIPRAYQRVEKNSRFFRGRLNVLENIRKNLTDRSRFYCSWAPLTMDVAINRTIRRVYNILQNETNSQYGLFLKDVSAHDNYLGSLGVQSSTIRQKDIDKIQYTRMNEAYRPLMQISRAIIGKLGGVEGSSQEEPNAMSYFIDIAEIWENYLLSVMRKHLEPEYTVIAPNETGGDVLFNNGFRSIRPDFLLKKKGKIVAVLDAKYKNYRRFGRIEESGSVKRADLYQMITYLHHYASVSDNVAGLFVAPVSSEHTEIVQLRRHENQRVGVLNLDISKFIEDREDKKNQSEHEEKEKEKNFDRELKRKEIEFVEKLKGIIGA